jgi:hypothetical protein
MKTRFYIPMIALLLAGCGGTPGWKGKEPEGKAAVLAQETCTCIYEVMDAESAFDLGAIMDGMEDFREHQRTGGSGSIEEKWPDIAKAMMMMMELSEKIDGSPCIGEVDDKAVQQGVSIEAISEILDQQCELAMFYN